MVLLISYDLNGIERPSAYAAVKRMIEENVISWEKPLYSQWFVETDEGVQKWHDRMEQTADSTDYWLVLRMQRPYRGWLNQEMWDWLNERI